MNERERVFRHWIREHRGIIAKVSRAYAVTPQDREDLTQEILLQLWRSTVAFRGDARESTWIYRVALNTAMAKRRAGRGIDDREVRVDVPAASIALPEDAADRDRVEWLYREIARLPEADRSLVLLYLDGFGYRDMAEILGISESNVGVKLNRLKKRLAARAEGVDDGP